ncbi:MAG: tryptophan synthase subunit alpha, partial [Firmicutes bacterium]|nr:tryptophan synthase subunit alpha [Bacillota bacterium]
MNRIDKNFEELKKEGKKAFIPYICAGDPSIEDTEKLIYALEESGCDVIELGVPYSDPLADGPVIQAAGLRSLNGGYKLGKMFDMIKRVR